MAYDPYIMNPYFRAQYPQMYQMPAAGQQQPQQPTAASTPVDQMNPFSGGGFQGAEGYGTSPGGSVVDTTGQFDTLGTAGLIGMAMPGGGFTNAFGRLAQSAFGPHAVVGWEDVGINHPQWGQKMAAIREANLRNMAAAAREMGGGFAGVASSRDISSGQSRGRGGISDPGLGRSAANRGGGGAENSGGRGGARDNDRSTDGRDHQGWR